MQRFNLLGAKVNKVTQSEAIEQIGAFIASGQPHYVVTANAEIIYQASQEPKMLQIINEADMVTADGSGVVWASNYIGEPLAERVTGIDLVHAICAQSEALGWKIYILGAAPGVAEQAVLKILEQYPKCHIAGYHHGYLQGDDEANVLAHIKQVQPDVLLVAMGAPRQEEWIRAHMEGLSIPVSMGIGGSLDVISCNLKRAPKWMQKLSLEWLYRLLIQPSRWKRVLALPKFVFAVRKAHKKG